MQRPSVTQFFKRHWVQWAFIGIVTGASPCLFLALLALFTLNQPVRYPGRLLSLYIVFTAFCGLSIASSLDRVREKPAPVDRRVLDWCLAFTSVVVIALINIDLIQPFNSILLLMLLLTTTLETTFAIRGIWLSAIYPVVVTNEQKADDGKRHPWRVMINRIILSLLTLGLLPLVMVTTQVATGTFHSDWRGGIQELAALGSLIVFSFGLCLDERVTKKKPASRSAKDAIEADLPEGFFALAKQPSLAQGHMGILLSKSATTGWWDWMHGELWLFSNGILRVPSGWIKTFSWAGYRYNASQPITKSFDRETFAKLTSNPHNIWMGKDQIATATLRHRRPGSSDELRIRFADGHTIQLLWLSQDRPFAILEHILSIWLGDRLEIVLPKKQQTSSATE